MLPQKMTTKLLKKRLIHLFLAVLCLCCGTRAFSSCGEGGYSLLLFIVVASLVEHRVKGMRALVVVVSRTAACRILVPRAGIQPVSPTLAGGF